MNIRITFFTLAVVLLAMAGTGCSTPATVAIVPIPTITMDKETKELFMQRWTASSNTVLRDSCLSAEAQANAKFAITVNGVAFFHCRDEDQFALTKIEPATIHPAPQNQVERWTTDVCGERKWLIDSNGKAALVPSS